MAVTNTVDGKVYFESNYALDEKRVLLANPQSQLSQCETKKQDTVTRE